MFKTKRQHETTCSSAFLPAGGAKSPSAAYLSLLFPASTVQEEEIMATFVKSEFTCTGRKRRNSNSNIVTKLMTSKITGKGFSRGTQVGEITPVLTAKTPESWTTATRDLRLESSLKTKTVCWR